MLHPVWHEYGRPEMTFNRKKIRWRRSTIGSRVVVQKPSSPPQFPWRMMHGLWSTIRTSRQVIPGPARPMWVSVCMISGHAKSVIAFGAKLAGKGHAGEPFSSIRQPLPPATLNVSYASTCCSPVPGSSEETRKRPLWLQTSKLGGTKSNKLDLPTRI